MRKKRSSKVKKLFRRWLYVASLIVGVFVMFYQSYSFDEIISKESNTIRVGYVNLNKSIISLNELTAFKKFDCDIWLFAEWNGNNFDPWTDFETQYRRAFEFADNKTMGFLVLAKDSLNLKAYEFDERKNPYQCNYKKLMLEYEDFNLAFLHAPPPVPSCKYETHEYINDALGYLAEKDANRGQLIIGDLNTLPKSKSYNLIIDQGFDDAFAKKSIFKGTYGGAKFLPKLVRIDYAFSSERVNISSVNRFQLKSSDHCGLLVDISTDTIN